MGEYVSLENVLAAADAFFDAVSTSGDFEEGLFDFVEIGGMRKLIRRDDVVVLALDRPNGECAEEHLVVHAE